MFALAVRTNFHRPAQSRYQILGDELGMTITRTPPNNALKSELKGNHVQNYFLEVTHLRPQLVVLSMHPTHVKCMLNTLLRIQLEEPCGEGMDLLTCPDFSAEQSFGPARIPRCAGYWAPEGECPRCDYGTYDMRRRRIIVLRQTGLRWGFGPLRRHGPGVEFLGVCTAM